MHIENNQRVYDGMKLRNVLLWPFSAYLLNRRVNFLTQVFDLIEYPVDHGKYYRDF